MLRGWGTPKKNGINWQKIEAIATILVAVFALIAVVYSWNASNRANDIADKSLTTEQQLINLTQQANNLTQFSLELQNLTSNWQPEIIPFSISATLPTVYTNATLDPFGQYDEYGSLNVSIIVITPHASIVNFTDTAFNATARQASGSDDFLNASNFFGSYLSLFPYMPYGANFTISYTYYWPEAFIQAGVTQLNFAIPIYAELALNSNFTGMTLGSGVGTVAGELTVFDVQTRSYVADYPFSTPVFLNVNWNT